MAIFLNNLMETTSAEKEPLAVRNKLPLCPQGLMTCVALSSVPFASFSAVAVADTYTRCEQVATTALDCLPGSGVKALPDSFTLQAEPSATLDTVFNWKVKNCKTKQNRLRGQLALILDNSKSAATTDPSSTRAGVLNKFMERYADKSLFSGVADNQAGYPQLALINYNGRAGIIDPNNRVDDYNSSFTQSYCSSPVPSYPDSQAIARWNETVLGVKLSICEFLPLRIADSLIKVSPLQQFASFAAQAPRGSTDFTYFFKGAAAVYQGANAANVGRHVLLVTDGLPNIPKNVPASSCKNTTRLKNESIVSGILLGQQRDYCVDRQAVQAIAEAHTEALNSAYSKLYFHHVLYTASQRAYFDYDNNGNPTLNPADFLIENSARTGNGKVKFSYAKEENDFESDLDKMFDVMDENALQYVTVRVQPAGGGEFNYNAVSPGAPQSEFSIKFIGLKAGVNTVTVTPVYQDGTSVIQVFTVTVAAGATSGLKCEPAGDDRTVDGDLKGAKEPKGDGFYNSPNNNGDFRDYRNADEANSLSENEFAVVGDDQATADFSKLRLQGGTGNCGSLAASRPRNSASAPLFFFLLALPAAAAHLLTRRSRRRLK